MLVNVTANSTLMLDFSCGIEGVPTINLTKDEIEVHYPLKGNIADDPEDDIEMPTTAPGPSNPHETVHGESFQNAAPPYTDSDAAPGTSTASVLGIIPTTLLATDKQQFFPQSIGRLKALMLKENRTKTLIKVRAEEASTRFNAHASQDKASYDGDISDAEENDIKVVPDEVDDTQIKGSKPVETIPMQTRTFQRLPTRRMAAKPQSLRTRTQLDNTATRPDLEPEMVWSVMTGTSLLMVTRTNILRITFLCTVFRGQAGFFL